MLAYALMRHAMDLEAVWQSSPRSAQWGEQLADLRLQLGAGDVGRYRGIGRFPLTEWHELGPGWEGAHFDPPEDPEPAARVCLADLLGPDDYQTASPRAFLPSLDEALQVWEALVSPAAFEVVELGTAADSPAQLLGFDIGYWGGGNFSILCDTAIWPTWHPPAQEARVELAGFASQLNASLLFPSADLARSYLDWYAHQDWAEKPPEEFKVIAVGAVETPRRDC